MFIIPKHPHLFACITLYLKLIVIFSSLIPRKQFQKYFLVHQMRLFLAHQKSSIIYNIQVCLLAFILVSHSAMPFVFKLTWSVFFFKVPEVKRRKRHRRKHSENQEPCLMRGVYFKNLKWQAAIKVDKKQIHLGTVGSQEEAARLYDRY